MGLAQDVMKRHKRMKVSRQLAVESVWSECYDFTFPLRGRGFEGNAETPNTAQEKQARNLDSTAADSCLVLASNIMSGLTPANSTWFALDVGDETPEERAWLDGSAKLLWENIHLSNFDAEGFEGVVDMSIAGMFALYIDEDKDLGGLTFQQWALSTVYAASTRPDGVNDIVHREYKLSAEQAEKEFGLDKLPERIRKDARDSPDTMHPFVHAIYPRKGKGGGKMAKNLPIGSCHIATATGDTVRESGYHEMPVVLPRWMRDPSSAYAVGPLYAAMPDVRQLNELKGQELAAADMAIAGMWAVADDGVFNARTTKIGPRKMLVFADVDNIKPLTSGSNFELSDMMVNRLQASIRKIMMADQLPPADGPAKTAYEYRVRVDMIRKLLGPVWGRLQAEYVKPLIDRTFGLAFRAGVFKEPPRSLGNRNFSVRYVSPMARSQKLDDVEAIETIVMAAGQMAALDPTIMDEIDLSKAIELMVDGRGAPHAIRRDPKDVAKLRQARAQAQEQAQAQQGAQQAQQVGMEAAAERAATG